MSKIPGLYFDIGKKARDVLYKDFARQPKTCATSYLTGDWSFDISCKSNLLDQIKPLMVLHGPLASATMTVQDIVPGLSALVGLVVPHSGKVELQYMQDYFGITGGMGLKADPSGVFSPVLNVSGVVGSSLFSFGTALAFDVATRALDKFNTGLSFNNDLLNSSLTLDKLDTVRASCYYTVNPTTNTAIAAELKHSFSTSDTSLAIGVQHAFIPLTTLKGKIDTHGKFAALIQQGLGEKFFVTLGGEVDFMDQRRIPNFGLSMALRV